MPLRLRSLALSLSRSLALSLALLHSLALAQSLALLHSGPACPRRTLHPHHTAHPTSAVHIRARRACAAAALGLPRLLRSAAAEMPACARRGFRRAAGAGRAGAAHHRRAPALRARRNSSPWGARGCWGATPPVWPPSQAPQRPHPPGGRCCGGGSDSPCHMGRGWIQGRRGVRVATGRRVTAAARRKEEGGCRGRAFPDHHGSVAARGIRPSPVYLC